MSNSKISKKLLHSVLFCFISITGFNEQVSASYNSGSPVTCNVNLREILPSPYADLSSIVCSRIWRDQFSFSFFQDTQNVTTFVVSGRHEHRWIGIGFSKDGKMVGSSAIVAWIERDGTSGLKQYYLEAKNMSRVLPDQGELRFTVVSPVVVTHGDLLYIAFQLHFANSLAYQPILLARGSGNPLHNGLLPKHLDSTAIYIEFSSALAAGKRMEPDELRRYHGTTAVIGWGILTPAGLIIARYFRNLEPAWYYLHSSTQFIGFFVGIISMSIGHNLYLKIEATFVAHKFVGYTVCFLAALEVCQFLGRPSSESKQRQYWNFAHYWVGRIAIAMGVSNIFVGFHGVEGDRGLKTSFLMAFVTLLMMAVVFEGRLWREKSNPKTIVDQPPVFRINKP